MYNLKEYSMAHDVTDDNIVPTSDTTPLDLQSEPGDTSPKTVPADIQAAGHSTNEPRDDSPESLDEEITQGADRERIDPDHSYDRPAVDTIDNEENGVN